MWSSDGRVYTVADRYDKAKKNKKEKKTVEDIKLKTKEIICPVFQDRLGRKVMVESGLDVSFFGDTVCVTRGKNESK